MENVPLIMKNLSFKNKVDELCTQMEWKQYTKDILYGIKLILHEICSRTN